MSREKELIKNTFIIGIGKLFPKFISIITLPILTALLTKEEYGTYDIITTLVMFLMPIATLQLQSAAFRFLIECRKNYEKSSEIITNIICVTIPISIIISLLLIIFWPSVSFEIRIAISIYFFVDILYLTLSQISRGLSYNKDYSISAMILSIIYGLSIIILLMVFHIGLFGVLVALISGNVLAILYLIIKCRIIQLLNFHNFSKNKLKELIAYSWPMIPNNLSNWILNLSDRLVITFFLGIESNAVYAVANKIPSFLSMAQSIYVMAWQENASIVVNDKDAGDYYTTVFNKTFSLVLGITAILIASTPILFYLLIKGDYDVAYFQMPILILGMFFYCMTAFQGGIYIAHKKTKSVGLSTTFAAMINLIIDLCLVNYIGITAGSLSTVIAYFLLYLYRIFDSKKFQKINYNIKKQFLFLICICIMLILCFLRNTILNVINMIFGLLIFIVLNKNFLIGLVFKKK